MKQTIAARGANSFGSESEPLNEDLEPPGIPADTVGLSSADVTTGVLRAPQLRRLSERLREPEPGINPRTLAFRQRFYPEVSPGQWSDWRWQWRNRIRTAECLSRILHLSNAERAGLEGRGSRLPVSITPYYASLLDPSDALNPLRRTVVPTVDEYSVAQGEAEDPLGEDKDSPVPGLVHRYPDRVLFLVTGTCASYCRYCTRSRAVGRGSHRFSPAQWERALAYIEKTSTVRDVLLSGGDPLTMPGERLEYLMGRLSRMPHVEIVRIGTKVPVVLPQRITGALVRMLKRYHPVWMSVHFTHPDELTPEVAAACGRLADAGIPLGSQTVLLKGVNDEVQTLRRLFCGLLRLRVRPYYLYQCDPICGSSHFRTTVEEGLDIVGRLRGHITGYAVPTYVVDAPGGGGKIPLLPDYVVGRDGSDLLLRNYAGNVYRYPDPQTTSSGPRGCDSIRNCRQIAQIESGQASVKSADSPSCGGSA